MATQKNKPNGPEEQPGKKKEEKNKYPPHLYLAGNKKDWILDFTWRGERYRQSIGPLSRSKAKERADTIRNGVAEGRIVVNSGRRWTGTEWVLDQAKRKAEDPMFDTAMDRFLAVSESTREASSYTTDFHNAKPLRAFFGACRLSEISDFLVEKYRIERRAVCECPPTEKRETASRCKKCGKRFKPLKDATINHELHILKSMFRRAVDDWNLAEKDPTRSVKLAKLRNERTRHLTPEEAQRLLDACNPDFRDLVLTAMHTGFRSNELRTLCWNSVDLANRFVTVRAADAKNKDAKSVPMTEDLFQMFSRIKNERDRGPDDLVFLSRYGKPWRSWRTAFENARKRAKITDFKFHDLRHCFASWLAMQGTAKKSMMELLGHRDPKMTDRYTHLTVDYNRQAVAKLPSFSNPESNPPGNPPREQEAKVVAFAK